MSCTCINNDYLYTTLCTTNMWSVQCHNTRSYLSRLPCNVVDEILAPLLTKRVVAPISFDAPITDNQFFMHPNGQVYLLVRHGAQVDVYNLIPVRQLRTIGNYITSLMNFHLHTHTINTQGQHVSTGLPQTTPLNLLYIGHWAFYNAGFNLYSVDMASRQGHTISDAADIPPNDAQYDQLVGVFQHNTPTQIRMRQQVQHDGTSNVTMTYFDYYEVCALKFTSPTPVTNCTAYRMEYVVWGFHHCGFDTWYVYYIRTDKVSIIYETQSTRPRLLRPYIDIYGNAHFIAGNFYVLWRYWSDVDGEGVLRVDKSRGDEPIPSAPPTADVHMLSATSSPMSMSSH